MPGRLAPSLEGLTTSLPANLLLDFFLSNLSTLVRLFLSQMRAKSKLPLDE